jgi:hypothetical protein
LCSFFGVPESNAASVSVAVGVYPTDMETVHALPEALVVATCADTDPRARIRGCRSRR